MSSSNKETDELERAIFARALRLYFNDTDRAAILTSKHVAEAMERVQADLHREVERAYHKAISKLDSDVSGPRHRELVQEEKQAAWVNGEQR